jgi:hypothetical protein
MQWVREAQSTMQDRSKQSVEFVYKYSIKIIKSVDKPKKGLVSSLSVVDSQNYSTTCHRDVLVLYYWQENIDSSHVVPHLTDSSCTTIWLCTQVT